MVASGFGYVVGLNEWCKFYQRAGGGRRCSIALFPNRDGLRFGLLGYCLRAATALLQASAYEYLWVFRT